MSSSFKKLKKKQVFLVVESFQQKFCKYGLNCTLSNTDVTHWIDFHSFHRKENPVEEKPLSEVLKNFFQWRHWFHPPPLQRSGISHMSDLSRYHCSTLQRLPERSKVIFKKCVGLLYLLPSSSGYSLSQGKAAIQTELRF